MIGNYWLLDDYYRISESKLVKCVAIFIFCWVIITYTAMWIYKCDGSLDEITRLQKELERKSKQLLVLKFQIYKLRTIKKFGLNSLKHLSMRNTFISPTKQYETLRHRIYSNMKDLCLYSKFVLSTICEDMNITKISIFLDELSKRKRSLLLSLEKLSSVDGYSTWRRQAARHTARVLQRRLEALQHPPDCHAAKKLLCDLNKNGGFGCQIHHVAHCLSFGYATNRTVVLNSTGWQYHAAGWENYFYPISSCSLDGIEAPVPVWNASSNDKVMLVPVIEEISPKPEFILPALPEDVARRIVLFNGNPLAWWVGKLVKYFMKPLDSIQKLVNQTVSKLNLKSPIVGIHIRRTDKINAAEAVYHELEEYLSHAEEYFSRLELMKQGVERRVYVATDDLNVLQEIQQRSPKYKNYTFLLERDIVKSAAIERRYSKQALVGLLIDLTVLASCDYVVVTFSSNVGRLVFELMQWKRVDASLAATSLDDVYYLSTIYAQDRLAVMPNHGGDRDISMEVGDQIALVPGGHSDGYDLGSNKRTLMTGLIPWYKTVEDPALYLAPKYDDEI